MIKSIKYVKIDGNLVRFTCRKNTEKSDNIVNKTVLIGEQTNENNIKETKGGKGLDTKRII